MTVLNSVNYFSQSLAVRQEQEGRMSFGGVVAYLVCVDQSYDRRDLVLTSSPHPGTLK